MVRISDFKPFIDSFGDTNEIKGEKEILKKYSSMKNLAKSKNLNELESMISRAVFDQEIFSEITPDDCDKLMRGLEFLKKNISIISEKETPFFKKLMGDFSKETEGKRMRLEQLSNNMMALKILRARDKRFSIDRSGSF